MVIIIPRYKLLHQPFKSKGYDDKNEDDETEDDENEHDETEDDENEDYHENIDDFMSLFDDHYDYSVEIREKIYYFKTLDFLNGFQTAAVWFDDDISNYVINLKGHSANKQSRLLEIIP